MGKYSLEYLMAGVAVSLLGAAFNFSVVAVNGMQMPVSLDYADHCFTVVESDGKKATISPSTIIPLAPGRVFADDNTRLRMLGDVIHVNNFAFHGYYSAGDIIIEFGAINIILGLAVTFLAWLRAVYHGGFHLYNNHAHI
jgi:hypothetical protein